MDSKIVEFPGGSRPFTDELHSKAFRDLETNLRDCVKMAGIAAQLVFDASIEDEQLRFAVFHSADMLKALEKEYDARWHGEERG